MNGTACGIITERGDCLKPVVTGAPLNLCAKHLQQAAELYADIAFNSEPAPRVRGRCPDCRCQSLRFDLANGLIRCTMCPHRERAKPTRAADPDTKQIRSGDPVVYYLTFGNRIKIGYTRDIRQRLASLPHDRLLGVERGDRDLERQRHRQFQHLRVTARGEWFHPGQDLFDFIDANTQQPAA